MSDKEALVRVSHVHKYYTRGGETVDVLKDLSLDIPEGDFLALMGPSGSGKTTLLNLLGGLDRPSEGTVEVAGQRIERASARELARWRTRHVGFVFQFYNLIPVLTAERNVELPLLLTSLSKAERRKRVAIALDVVGLAERARNTTRGSSRAARSSASASRAPSSPTRRCSSATSPPATSTARAPTRSSSCCRRSTRTTARPSSSSPTTPKPPSAPSARSTSTRDRSRSR